MKLSLLSRVLNGRAKLSAKKLSSRETYKSLKHFYCMCLHIFCLKHIE